MVVYFPEVDGNIRKIVDRFPFFLKNGSANTMTHIATFFKGRARTAKPPVGPICVRILESTLMTSFFH